MSQVQTVNIQYLPKDILLYHLWKHAKVIHYFENVKDIPKESITLTIDKAREEIAHMEPETYLTYFYGRTLFIDITGNDFYCGAYNRRNGKNLAQLIIRELKIAQLEKTALKYYLS